MFHTTGQVVFRRPAQLHEWPTFQMNRQPRTVLLHGIVAFVG